MAVAMASDGEGLPDDGKQPFAQRSQGEPPQLPGDHPLDSLDLSRRIALKSRDDGQVQQVTGDDQLLSGRSGRTVEELTQQIIRLSQQLSQVHQIELAETRRGLKGPPATTQMATTASASSAAAPARSTHIMANMPTEKTARSYTAGRDKLGIMVVGASDLRDADWVIGTGSSDPYCVCTVMRKDGSQQDILRTSAIQNTLNPVWDHSELHKGITPEDTLRFQVWDEDPGKADDSLGHADLPASDFLPDGFKGALNLTGEGARNGSQVLITMTIEEDDQEQFANICGASLDKWNQLQKDSRGSLWTSSSTGHSDRNLYPRHGEMRAAKTFFESFVVSPYASRKMLWNTFALIALLYDAFMIPLMFAFGPPPSWHIIPVRIALVTYWTLDIISTFFTGIHHDGIIDFRLGNIAWRYFKTWLLLDVLVVCADWIFVIYAEKSAGSSLARIIKVSRGIRVFRLLGMVRLGKFQSVFDTLLASIYQETATIVCRLIESLLVIIMATHFTACIWYLLGTREGTEKSWADPILEEPYWYRYLTSFHWALTQITPASMAVQPVEQYERLYTVAVDLVGLIAFSTFISSITATMTQLRQLHQTYANDVKAVKNFFLANSVSVPLGCKILAFLRVSRIRSSASRTSADSIKALAALPAELRQELDLEVYQQILMVHPAFEALQATAPPLLSDLAMSGLQEKPLMQGEFLFKKFGVAKHMWFNIYGQMVYKRDATRRALDVGTWVSEAALWVEGWLHRGDLESVKQSNVVGLETSTFNHIIGHHMKKGRGEWLIQYATRFISLFAKEEDSPFYCTDIWCDAQQVEDILVEVNGERPAWKKALSDVRGRL